MLKVIAALIIIAIILSIFNGRRIRKENEKNSCNGGCSSCISRGQCTDKEKK